jgi:hypothetical protein
MYWITFRILSLPSFLRRILWRRRIGESGFGGGRLPIIPISFFDRLLRTKEVF